jgi:NADPH-dependent glutamate synthase beta subunit-like oxidoreductase
MPAFAEEIEGAWEEGVQLVELVSPVRMVCDSGRLRGIVCVRNSPGPRDASGRRSPVPVPGSEHVVPLDTLIVAVGEAVDGVMGSLGLAVHEDGRLRADVETLETSRPGVFAGGDAASGPATVVEAIAAGKRAAVAIHRYLQRAPLRQPAVTVLPAVFVAPGSTDAAAARRAAPPILADATRRSSFAEVELPLPAEDARREARRCLRCDLDFTRPPGENAFAAAAEGTAP